MIKSAQDIKTRLNEHIGFCTTSAGLSIQLDHEKRIVLIKDSYICNECLSMFREVKATIFFPTYDLKQDYPKTEDIRLH